MLSFRIANLSDIKLYFDWANDNNVREQSYNSNQIDFKNHKEWFESKLEDCSCIMLVFENEDKLNIGQIRIQKVKNNEALIGISIASEHRGKGYAKEMIYRASDYFLDINPMFVINAYIKEHNLGSKFAFEKSGYELIAMIDNENCNSFHLIKRHKNED